MKKLNIGQLETLLRNQRGTTAVALVAETVPTMRKTGNPLAGNLVKLSRVSGMIGFRYANSVNNQRLREETPELADGAIEQFEALPRTWGTRIEGTPLVEHKGRLYLEVKVERMLERQFRRIDTGEIVPDELVAPYLPERRESARQQVAKEVVLRDYKLDSIVQLSLRGEQYEIRGRKSEVGSQKKHAKAA